MARVIATGGTPQHDFGQGLRSLGQNLTQFAQIREMAAQREAQNAFAKALQAEIPQMNADGTPTEISPIAKAFHGMDANQLGSFLRANPSLIRDPQKMSELMRGGEDYEYRTVNDSLVRIGKRSGKTEEIFKGSRSNKVDFKVVNKALYKVNPGDGTFERMAEEKDPADAGSRAQDPLGKLNADFRSGLVSREDMVARRAQILKEGGGTEPKLETVQGLGGATVNKRTGEVLSPGRINVVSKDGEERTVVFSSKAELDTLTAKLNSGELTETSKGGRQPGSDLGAKSRANLEVKRQEAAKSQLSKETGGFIQFSNTLREVRKSPAGAFGARGSISKGLGGLVGQVSPETGNALAGLLSGGADQNDLTTLKTNARALIAATIPVATGEEGTDRISNAERAISEETLGIFSNLSDKNQATAALSQLMVLKLAGMERLRIEAGLDPEFDFDKLDDVKRLTKRYMDEFGMDGPTAAKAFRVQRDVRREISPLFQSKK